MPNRPSGEDTATLRHRAAEALVREWGVSYVEACAAIARCARQERRLGRELAAAARLAAPPEPREPVMIDLTAEWLLYIDGPTARIVAA